MNHVTALVTKKKLTLIPDIASDVSEVTEDDDRAFDVTVINNSDKFASFQLELIAPGLDPQAEIDWYRVEPEICAKKPPGDRTTFHVTIIKPPIPAYDTTIDITLRAFSVEFANLFTSQTLHLKIEKPRRSLRVYLPAPIIKVFPGDLTEIPVLVNNLSSKSTEITLRLTQLDTSWFKQGTTQLRQLEPGDSKTVSFWCQPLLTNPPLSQSYDFVVEGQSGTSKYIARDQGAVEVLPQGVVEFNCDFPEQTVPAQRQTNHPHKPNIATYELKFVNASNLAQQVTLQSSETDRQQCCLKIPDSIDLAPGEPRSLFLSAHKSRPWIGLKQRFSFEVSPLLSHPITDGTSDRIHPHPSHRTLELYLLPRLPLWLQLGGLLLTTLIIWLASSLLRIGHQSTVNFVRFSGDGTTVLSASSDRTLRRWQINNTRWQPETLQHWNLRQLTSSENVGAQTGKAVRIIRHRPQDNDVAAVGLEDGTIQLWNLSRGVSDKTLYSGNDRVFDLVFTPDSKTLFSGHGSGNVYARSLTEPKRSPRNISQSVVGNPPLAELVPKENRVRFLFTISSLALSEDQSSSLVVVAGQFNKLALWDWQNQKVYEVPYVREDPPHKFNLPMGKQQYINSLSTAKNLLATADSEGLITLWDMKQVRQCSLELRPRTANQSGRFKTADENPTRCSNAILKQWNEAKQPIRSVALSRDGCYLASAGDDGRVVLTPIQNQQPQLKQQKVLGQFHHGIRSVDISSQGNEILVTSDADGDRVMLYRLKKDSNHADCQ